MSEIECPIQRAINKIKNPEKVFKDKTISIIFNTLPPMSDWSHSMLDHSTKVFLNNVVHYLAGRSANIQVTSEKETIVNLIVNKGWERYGCAGASFKEVSEQELVEQADAIVAIGLREETMNLINQNNKPCVVIRTSKTEVFPLNSKVIESDPDFSVHAIITALTEIIKG